MPGARCLTPRASFIGIILAMEILVVDDELSIRRGLAELMAENGYSVRMARDGIAALRAVRTRRPDLVLLDVMMPLMDGFAVCEKIRKHDRDLPILFLTAKDGDADQVRGLELGADDFVSKGVDYAVLLVRIRKALERAERLLGNAAPDNLTKTEADIFRLLASEQGRYFSALEIFSAIRGEGYFGDEGNLRSHMSRLRGKLPKGVSLLSNRGRGYALVTA